MSVNTGHCGPRGIAKDPIRRLDACVHGVAVGVGDADTTLKVTVIAAPLVPTPPGELHGVATNVWFPSTLGVHVKSKGLAESVFTDAPSLLNTTLRVLVFACAVTV